MEAIATNVFIPIKHQNLLSLSFRLGQKLSSSDSEHSEKYASNGQW